MALDFPANPAVDDEYQGFKWDGNSWVPISSGGATGDFLPLTGGSLSGPITYTDAAGLKLYPESYDAAERLWSATLNGADIFMMRFVNATQTVDFGKTPTVFGTPVVLDAPADDLPYVRKNGAWLGADPPLDGQTYSRKDGAWVVNAAAGGDFLPLAGGTLTGNLTFSGANLSVIFNGGSKIYAHSDKAMRICQDSQGRQPQIADNAGGSNRDIIDTTNGDARYLKLTGGTISGNVTFGSDKNLVMADSTSNIRGISGNGVHYLVSGNDNHCHGFFASGVLKMHVWNGGVTVYGTFTDALEADIPGSKDGKGGTNIGKTLALMAAKIKQLEAEITKLQAGPKKGSK